MTRWLAPLLAALPAPAAALDLLCQFETECFEAEACDEAAFELAVAAGEAPDTARLGSIADDTLGALSTAESGAQTVVARTASSLQILTIGADGTARYTLHLTDGPAMVSYLGQCESPG